MGSPRRRKVSERKKTALGVAAGTVGLVQNARDKLNAVLTPLAWVVGFLGIAGLVGCAILWLLPLSSWPEGLTWEQLPLYATGSLVASGLLGWGCMQGGLLKMREVFGTHKQTGVPPGFVAELHWNFGLTGVLLGMFALGLFLRSLVGELRPGRPGDAGAALVYVTIMLPFAFVLPGNSLTQAIVACVRGLIPILLAVHFLRAGGPARSLAASTGAADGPPAVI